MSTCAECTERLLDYLFGLLDEKEAELLREHLSSCPDCQRALAEAKRLQNLIVRAARKYSEVPAFAPPADEILPLPAASTFPQVAAATLPPPQRPRATWRRWAAFGAAAAVLLAVSALYAGFQRGLSERQQNLANARKEIESLDARLDHLTRDSQRELAAVPAKVQEQFLQVNVVGPAVYQPGATNQYRVDTQTPLGKPAPARVTVKLMNQAANGQAGPTVFNKVQQIDGDSQLVLPANLPVPPGSTPRLVFEVTNSTAVAVVEQPLTALEPSYVTHLALNQSTFRPGEVLFFRTVTLERFALTPVDRPLTLSCALYRVVGQNSEPVKELQCLTQAGGIAGGELALPENLPAGDYVFVVAEVKGANGKSSTVRPVTRHIRIERGNQPAVIAGAGAKGGGGAGKGGGGKQTAPNFAAEFFPEGGDLVAGAANRVYFRLATPNFPPKGLEAIVEDSKQQEVAKIPLGNERTSVVRNQTLGSFIFTPQFGEVYRLRLTVPGKSVDSWPLPKVLQSGVSLTVSHAVLAATEPLRVQVRSSQREPLLVVVNCRGQTVEQKIVPTDEKLTDVHLETLAGSDGVLRVTVYEKDGSDWRPAAERLVYRRPAAYLNLSTKLKDAAKGYKPGDHVQMRIESRDEANANAAAWLLALVIDEKAARPGELHAASPPAFFLLDSELRDPEELEDADFLLTDSPAAAKALDLFLGTQGWRRFTSRQAADAPSNLIANKVRQQPGQLALFSAGNQRDAVFASYSRAVEQQQFALVQETERQRADLQSSRDTAAAGALAAATALADYEVLPLNLLRYGIAILLVILLAVGAALLLIGLIVALRAKSSPRLLLASSSAILFVAFIFYFSTGSLRTAPEESSVEDRLAWLTPREGPGRDNDAIFPHQEQPGQAPLAKVTGDLYVAAVSRDSKADLAKTGEASSVAQAAAVRIANNLQPDVKKAVPFATGGKGGAGGGAGGGGFGGGKAGSAPQINNMATPKAALQLQNDNATQGTNQQALGAIADKANVLREYANSNAQVPVRQPEMLLWSPQLFAADGSAEVSFDLPGKTASYRIVIFGHTANGRLGAYHGKLDAKN